MIARSAQFGSTGTEGLNWGASRGGSIAKAYRKIGRLLILARSEKRGAASAAPRFHFWTPANFFPWKGQGVSHMEILAFACAVCNGSAHVDPTHQRMESDRERIGIERRTVLARSRRDVFARATAQARFLYAIHPAGRGKVGRGFSPPSRRTRGENPHPALPLTGARDLHIFTKRRVHGRDARFARSGFRLFFASGTTRSIRASMASAMRFWMRRGSRPEVSIAAKTPSGAPPTSPGKGTVRGRMIRNDFE